MKSLLRSSGLIANFLLVFWSQAVLCQSVVKEEYLDNEKVWEASFKSSTEIRSGLSKFLPNIDPIKLQNLVFTKFGALVLEDTCSDRIRDPNGRMCYSQKYFLSDFLNYMKSLRKNKTVDISREELRALMKKIRERSQETVDAVQEYHYCSILLRSMGQESAEINDPAQIERRNHRVELVKDLKSSRDEVERLTGKPINKLISDKPLHQLLLQSR